MKRTHSHGFGIVEIILIVFAVGIISGLGYTFYTSMTKKSQTANVQTQTATPTTPAVESTAAASIPVVNSTKDLTSASTTLDQLDLEDSSDSSQLTSQQSAF